MPRSDGALYSGYASFDEPRPTSCVAASVKRGDASPLVLFLHGALRRPELYLDQHIPEAPWAELRELGETFNRMAAALREQHEQLERQAFTDSLTGVPNRALFERRARAALERGRGTVGVHGAIVDHAPGAAGGRSGPERSACTLTPHGPGPTVTLLPAPAPPAVMCPGSTARQR